MATNNESAPSRPPEPQETHPFGLRTIMELFDIGPVIAITALSAAAAIIIAATIYFFESAPPSTLTMSAGPEGSSFQKSALKYAKVLERSGVKVKILPSEGSLQNLLRVSDPKTKVDVGFVQAGIVGPSTDEVVSLGSVSYQPLFVFYRGAPLELLSGLAGKKVAVGPVGSGTRNFALALLAQNGITEAKDAPPGPALPAAAVAAPAKKSGTTLLDLDADRAATELLNHTIDAAFVMSESTSTELLKKLMRSSDVHLYSFKQAHAYARKNEFLHLLELPEGSIDFGLDIPSHDVELLGPMVELIASKQMHPAFSDLLLDAMVEVHSHPGIFQKRGEFPAPIEHSIHVSDDAQRYFKSGRGFFYRYLPFWLASLVSRLIVVFLPMLVILVPMLRSIPAFFRWQMQSRIRRRYRELLALEREFLESDHVKQEQLRNRFDRIENAVNRMKVRASFADQFYGLRGHIAYVRQVVARK